jgi:hypothetical protein
VTIFRDMARGKQPTKPAQIDTLAAGGGFLVFFSVFLLLGTLIWGRYKRYKAGSMKMYLSVADNS